MVIVFFACWPIEPWLNVFFTGWPVEPWLNVFFTGWPVEPWLSAQEDVPWIPVLWKEKVVMVTGDLVWMCVCYMVCVCVFMCVFMCVFVCMGAWAGSGAIFALNYICNFVLVHKFSVCPATDKYYGSSTVGWELGGPSLSLWLVQVSGMAEI